MAKTIIHSCFLLFFFCFLHNQLIVNAILDPTDFLALQSIRKALEHMPQTISSLKNLRFIGVNRNFISGEIPAELCELRSLQTI